MPTLNEVIAGRHFKLEAYMPEYEIRVLKADRYSSAIILEQSFGDDEAAIGAALLLARGAEFEVWRDLDCVYGLASNRPVAASWKSQAQPKLVDGLSSYP
jgi:hypothetical protein